MAEERDGIAAEPPIDVEKWAANWRLEGTLVALAEGVVVGEARVESTPFGFGEIGMMVARDWRGRGVGRREKQIRRANGEIWDLIEMGLQL